MLGRIINLNQVGLYRDDGLIFIPDSNDPKTSKIHLKSLGHSGYWLKIEITSHLKIVNFLDETFNLENDTFKLLNKNNYIHNQYQL